MLNSMKHLFGATAAVGLVVAFGAAGDARAAAPAAAVSAGELAKRCTALVGNRFESLPGAPTEILSAKVNSQPGGPESCDISGNIAPQITITMRLPIKDWNGKLFVAGCGGMCGTPVRPGSIFDSSLNRGYAVITNDTGHHSGGTAGTEGQWAYNNLLAKLDFGFRATHATTVLGKAIVAAFYDKRQNYAYFQGCSTGGRQGLIAAQRFADDFDGIISGAPVNIYATGSFQQVWAAMANRRADGTSIMLRPDVELLHRTAINACDEVDGLKDGLIDNPKNCKFDPGVLQCKAGETANCLTPEKIEVARKVYSGPVTSKGEKIHTGAPEVGSELTWIHSSFDDGEKPGALMTFGMEKVRYVNLSEGPSMNATDVNWDRDPDRARGLDSVFAATNPDLRKFKARGGKLIQYHGWNDETAVPMNSIDYYEMARRTMGGPALTNEFYRLFMIPGMNHCSGGAAAGQIDWLTALENWVEKKQAPDRLVGKHVEQSEVKYTRPHFPYPDVARYTGSGDQNQAENFQRFTPPN